MRKVSVKLVASGDFDTVAQLKRFVLDQAKRGQVFSDEAGLSFLGRVDKLVAKLHNGKTPSYLAGFSPKEVASDVPGSFMAMQLPFAWTEFVRQLGDSDAEILEVANRLWGEPDHLDFNDEPSLSWN